MVKSALGVGIGDSEDAEDLRDARGGQVGVGGAFGGDFGFARDFWALRLSLPPREFLLSGLPWRNRGLLSRVCRIVSGGRHGSSTFRGIVD